MSVLKEAVQRYIGEAEPTGKDKEIMDLIAKSMTKTSYSWEELFETGYKAYKDHVMLYGPRYNGKVLERELKRIGLTLDEFVRWLEENNAHRAGKGKWKRNL